MKITMYKLLGMVKDGKAPKKIKYMDYIFEYDTNHKRYESYFEEQIWTLNDFVNIDDNLNDTVEILEEESKVQLEYLDKINENIKRVSDYIPKPSFLELKEEKKIPEKLDIRQEKNIKNNWKWKVYGKEHSYNISTPQKIIADKVNEICDYLKSKGE